MNIGFFIFDIKEAGEFKRCFNIAKNLANYGHQATIITGNTLTSFFPSKEIRENVTVIKLPYLHPNNSDHRISVSGEVIVQPQEYVGMFFLFIYSFLISLLYNFDLIHCFSFSTPSISIVAYCTKYIKRKRVILDWVDIRNKEGISKSYNYIIRNMYTFLERSTLSIGDSLTVISSYLAKQAISYGIDSKKIYHIPTGSNIDHIKPYEKSFVRNILGFNNNLKIIVYEGGSSTSLTSLLYLVDSFSLARKTLPNMYLILIGCSFDNNLHQKIIESNLLSSVKLIKRLDLNELNLYLSLSDLLVLPLEDNEIHRAGWAGRFGDLICVSRPILTHNVGDVPKLINRNKIGLVAIPGDINDFSEKMLEILNNPFFEINAIQTCPQIAKKYSWEKLSKKIALIYNNNIESDWQNDELLLF